MCVIIRYTWYYKTWDKWIIKKFLLIVTCFYCVNHVKYIQKDDCETISSVKAALMAWCVAVISIPNSITGILELEGEIERGSCDIINRIIVKEGKFSPLLNYLLVAKLCTEICIYKFNIISRAYWNAYFSFNSTHVNSYAILLENLKFTLW